MQFYVLEDLWPAAAASEEAEEASGQRRTLKQAPVAPIQIQFKYFRAGRRRGGLQPGIV